MSLEEKIRKARATREKAIREENMIEKFNLMARATIEEREIYELGAQPWKPKPPELTFRTPSLPTPLRETEHTPPTPLKAMPNEVSYSQLELF